MSNMSDPRLPRLRIAFSKWGRGIRASAREGITRVSIMEPGGNKVLGQVDLLPDGKDQRTYQGNNAMMQSVFVSACTEALG